jgi:hypothetical protein
VFGERSTDTRQSTLSAAAVVIGTVQQILPARWTTVDGLRPADPRAPANRETIFTPVLLTPQQYLKGSRPDSVLTVAAFGGTVGQDSVDRQVDDIDKFQPGQRVIVFLVPQGLGSTTTLNGVPLWGLTERYTLTADGKAINSNKSVAAAQLLTEVQSAIGP